jgi:hypothetical protein
LTCLAWIAQRLPMAVDALRNWVNVPGGLFYCYEPTVAQS